MSKVMASETDCTDDGATQWTEEGPSTVKQQLEDIDDRLATLSEKIAACERVLDDLKALRSHVLVRNSLQDVSLPSQE